MSVIKHSIIFIAFLFLFFKSKGQELYFVNISQSLNLPSEECYDVMQDKQGFIWISAEKGLLKISGSSQTLYNKSNSVFDGDVYSMCAISDSSNLFVTSNNSVLQSTPQSLSVYKPLNQILKSIPSKPNENPLIFYNLCSIENGRFCVANQNSSYILNERTNSYKLYNPLSFVEQDLSYLIEVDKPNPVFAKLNAYKKHDDFLKNRSRLYILIKNNLTTKKVELDFTKTGMPVWRVIACKIQDKTCFAIQNKLVIINKDLTFKIIEAPKRVIGLYADSNNGLWVGCHSGGGYYFEDINNINSFSAGKKLLSDYSVSGFCEDHEKNIWCTTLEKGVFFSANKSVTYFPNTSLADRKSQFIRPLGNTVYTLSKQRELFAINGNKSHQITIHTKKELEISDIAKIKETVFISTKGYLFELRLAKSDFFEKQTYPYTIYQLDECNGKVFALGKQWVSEIGIGYLKKIGMINTSAYCMKVVNDSLIYIGGSDGVYKLNSNSLQVVKLKGVSSRINRIIKCNNGELLVASESEGLGEISNGIVNRTDSVLLPNCINDIAEDYNGQFWLATQNGIVKYERKNKIVYTLNNSNGIMPGYINKIAVDSSFVYTSSQNGFSAFSLDANLYNGAPPNLKMKFFKINGVENKIESLKKMSYQSNNIELKFDLFTYKKGGQEGIAYSLSPFDTSFSYSKDATLHYKNLTPGTYTLTVFGVNNNGVKSLNPLVYTFTIQPPFWQTVWFIILCVVSIILMLALIIFVAIKQIRKKEQEKSYFNKLISDSQLSALQAQMNPHFIFNAINSIQNYILDKNEKQAYDYLSKFSKLIRKVLNNSKQPKVLLYDELETLKLYVELEKLRFENDFEYVVTVDEQIDLNEIFIPTMIIQPYVENAIWHGLINLKNTRTGKLNLSIHKINDFLHIKIEDNGIGRAKSTELRVNNVHKPEGMSITKKRVELINNMRNKSDSSIEVTDKYTDNGIAAGTIVEIRININDYDQ